MPYLTCKCKSWEIAMTHGFAKEGDIINWKTGEERHAPMIVGKNSKQEIRYCPWCGEDLTNKCRSCKNYHIYAMFTNNKLYQKCDFDAKYGDESCKFELSEEWKE